MKNGGDFLYVIREVENDVFFFFVNFSFILLRDIATLDCYILNIVL